MNTVVQNSIFNDPELVSLLSEDIDPWLNTPLQGYVDKNNKVKGKYGELFAKKMLVSLNHTVAPSPSSGYDLISNGINTEIKFSAANRNSKNKALLNIDVFTFNHLSTDKEWDRAILIGINLINNQCIESVFWFTKADFSACVSRNEYFGRQQGGKDGMNNDWMFATNPVKWQKFIKESWVHPITAW